MSRLYSVENGVVVFHLPTGDEEREVIAALKARAASVSTLRTVLRVVLLGPEIVVGKARKTRGPALSPWEWADGATTIECDT
jgi:hypothetical protein